MKRILFSLLLMVPCFCFCQEGPLHNETAIPNGTIVRNVPIPTENLGGQPGLITVYLPAGYETSEKAYPVLYLLHGMLGDNNSWEKDARVSQITDTYVAEGKCPEMIIVMPDCDDNFYVNGYKEGINYETFFHNNLIPFVESHYRCRTERNFRAIAGLSMGGFGTIYHAFNYPEKFCLAYAMSGALGGRRGEITPSLKSIFEKKGYDKNFKNLELPVLYVVCGEQDELCGPDNREAHAYLSSIGFEDHYETWEGAHEWKFWRQAFYKLLDAIASEQIFK